MDCSAVTEIVESPFPDVHKRPSYMEISYHHQEVLPDIDTRVIKKLDTQFEIIAEEEELEDEPIKTYLRIRPHMKKDDNEPEVLEVVDDRTVICQSLGPMVKGKAVPKRFEFKFSRVLDANCSQKDVFENSIAPLIDLFEQGENCLVFSYGATNSGKTYTMRGSATQYGIIPRTLYHIFSRFDEKIHRNGDIQPCGHESTRSLPQDQYKIILEKKKLLLAAANETVEMKRRRDNNIRTSDISSHCASLKVTDGMLVPDVDLNSFDGSHLYGMWISFVELYNEKCFDLLAGKGKRTEVKLVAETGGYTYFKDLTEIPVFSEEEAYALYVAGYKKLEFAATAANQSSSRSHCFFTIRVVQLGITSSSSSYPTRVHRITFCDLAGCERNGQTHNTGDQLKESANINQSLLSLLKVIRLIREKQARGHGKACLETIPFRDSKLTRIFQGYFTASTHIAMIVNVNPMPKMAESSMQTLQNSAIASSVVAFRPKPKEVLIEHNQRNSSLLHSTLGLDDVIEEDEEESADFENISSSRSSVEEEVTNNTSEMSSDPLAKFNETIEALTQTLKEKDLEIKKLKIKLQTIECETRETLLKAFSQDLSQNNKMISEHYQSKYELSAKRNKEQSRMINNRNSVATQTDNFSAKL